MKEGWLALTVNQSRLTLTGFCEVPEKGPQSVLSLPAIGQWTQAQTFGPSPIGSFSTVLCFPWTWKKSKNNVAPPLPVKSKNSLTSNISCGITQGSNGGRWTTPR